VARKKVGSLVPLKSAPFETPSTNRERETAVRPNPPRASRSLLRDFNVSLLIELVRRSVSISRAELARQSRLSAPTVSAIIDDLLKRGIVVENNYCTFKRGRPPVLPEFECQRWLRRRYQVTWRRADDGGL